MKSKKTVVRLLALLLGCVVLVTVVEVNARSGGVSGYSQSGATCHSGSPSPAVTVTITGVPSSYTPLSNYVLQVAVAGGPATTTGGFDLNASAGTLTTTDANARIRNGEATNSNGNVRSWTVNWRAPAAGTGIVTFHVAGLASNDDGGTSGDGWNTAVYTSNELSSNQRPVISLTSPTGTQDWTGGISHAITWTMTDDTTPNANLKVYLNYTSGAGSGSIAGPLTGVTSYAWSVPTIDAVDARVNATVIDAGGLKGFSQVLIPKIDSTRPTVSSASPTGTTVPLSAPIVIDFSEQMSRAATQAALSLAPDPGGWTYAWSPRVVPDDTLTASHAGFASATVYTATLGVGAKDASDTGNFLAVPYIWSFTTISGNSPPNIAFSLPAGGESWTGGSNHNVAFAASDVEDAAASLKVWVNYSITGGAPFSRQVAGLQGASGTSSPYAWTIPLENSVSVMLNATVIDTGRAKGYANSPLFEIDSTPPTVQLVSPAPGAIGVPTNANIVVTWSEPMNTAATEGAFSLKETVTWTTVAGAFSWAGNLMTFNPTALLIAGRQYSANITVATKDDSQPGNSLAVPYLWTFTAAVGTDTEKPQLRSLTAIPDPQEVFLAVNVSLEVQDNMAVDEVWLNVTDPLGGHTNATMGFDTVETRYFLERNYNLVGLHTAVVWGSDTSGNWDSATKQFTIRDSTPPAVTNPTAVPDPVSVSSTTNLSAFASDNYMLLGVWVRVTAPDLTSTNHSMSPGPRYYFNYVPTQLGTYVFVVSASDTSDRWASASNTIEAVDNTPPVANAGPDQSIYVGEAANFDGTGSTDNVGIDSYTWTFNDNGPVSLTGAHASHIFNQAGDFVVTLTVEDESDLQGTDTMTVHVLTGTDQPPAAPLSLVVQTAGSDALRLTWNANTESDLAGYKVYRSLTQGGPYTLLNPVALVTATTYLDQDLDGGHTYYYVVTAVDNGGHESTRSNEASGYIAGETDDGTGTTAEASPIDWRWALIPVAGFSALLFLVALLLHGKKKGDKEAEDSPSEAATQRENK
jgi:hypothetical protein